MHLPKTKTLLFVLLTVISFALCEELSPQEQLLEKFFGSSRRMAEVIPKKNLVNSSSPLSVSFTFLITHIFDIRSDEEEIDLTFWIAMRWKNELVSWNVNDYPIEYLEVPASKVWIPKLYLLENTQSTFLRPDADTSVVMVFPDGYTQLDFGIKIKLSCPMSACLFPMDKHECPIFFFSPGYHTRNLVFVSDPVTRKAYEFFQKNTTGLWTMEMHDILPATKEFNMFKGKKANLSVLTSSISLTRKPEYYWLTMLAPITLLCIITFCAVLLPRETGERTSLLITCLLAQIVYLDTILKNVPKTSDYVPLLVIFLCVVLVFTASQIGLTAITSYYAERASKGQNVSSWHRKIIKIFSKVCMIKKNDNQVKSLKQDSFYKNEVELRKKPSLEMSVYNQNATEDPTLTTELPTLDEDTDLPGENEPTDKPPKACKAMCKVIDRFSMFTSLVLLIGTPLLFQFMYDGTIKYDCTVKR